MGAYVEEKLKGGYILDEVKLIKVADLIKKRIGDALLNYKVFRGDSYSYETTAIQDVINEDNEDWRAITKLQLYVKHEDGLDFELTFSDGASVYITGNDRDAVFLIYSDLREYLRNEVMVRAPLSKNGFKNMTFFFMFSMLAVLSLLMTNLNSNEDPSIVQAVLKSADANEKLNFLVSLITSKKQYLETKVTYWVLPLMLISLLGLTGFLEKVWNWARPSNILLFGGKKRIINPEWSS